MNFVKTLACVLLFTLSLSLTSCLREAGSPDSGMIQSEPQHSTSETSDKSTTETEEGSETEIESFDYSQVIHPEEEVSEVAAMWIDAHKGSDNVILTLDEIFAENDRIKDASPTVVDILDFKSSYTKEELKSSLEKFVPFSDKRYDSDGTPITKEHIDSVVANRGAESLQPKNKVLRGIVTSRANLRGLPDDKPYRTAPDNPYDSIQLTELHVGTPLWVLHESLDGEYFFVKSFNYEGWVKSKNIAVTNDEELWQSFADPEEFVCVTDTKITLCTEEVDMGVRLLLVGIRNGKYEVVMPRRGIDGELVKQAVSVDPAFVSYGYLPYTYENFIIQAFKYEGTMYSWGGLDTGVDCSGFISNVMRTFGFMFPRDTKDQGSVVGSSVSMSGKTHDEIAAFLADVTVPTAVYYPGHVLFYLGRDGKGGVHNFIHAPKIGEAVSVTTKESLAGMTFACPIG